MVIVLLPPSIEQLRTIHETSPISCIGSPYPGFPSCEERISIREKPLRLAFQNLHALKDGIQFHGKGLIEALTLIARGFSCAKTHRDMEDHMAQFALYWLVLALAPDSFDRMRCPISNRSLHGTQRRRANMSKTIKGVVERIGPARRWCTREAIGNLDEYWWQGDSHGAFVRKFYQTLNIQIAADLLEPFRSRFTAMRIAQHRWKEWHKSLNKTAPIRNGLMNLSLEEFTLESNLNSEASEYEGEGESENSSELTHPVPGSFLPRSSIRTPSTRGQPTTLATPVSPQTATSVTEGWRTQFGSEYGGGRSRAIRRRSTISSPSSPSDHLMTRSSTKLQQSWLTDIVSTPRSALIGSSTRFQHLSSPGIEEHRAENHDQPRLSAAPFPEDPSSPHGQGSSSSDTRSWNSESNKTRLKVIQTTSAVFSLMRKDLSPSQRHRDQHIYAFRHLGTPRLIKIGRTSQEIGKRQKEIERDLAIKLEVFNANDYSHVPNYARVEQLILAALEPYRRMWTCNKCKHGDFMNHKEWFEIDEDTAIEVVDRWRDWMNGSPYQNGQLTEAENDRIDLHMKQDVLSELVSIGENGKDSFWDWKRFFNTQLATAVPPVPVQRAT